ncbi:hypothetical protein [Kutzneria kofuensis]|uniref:ATP-grasp domain-containing protein n=1 Tax=Kutzneria kofuensis TaxID=103725 RepID=A0A7W9NG92_9PSEU|nr:hypothetical protein [Kutzneria kofuensis]MBB5891249.1 hypothetical protein [Kutzneria kofuensis]
MTAVHLGTFDAERWWRPPDLATLPAAGGGDAAGSMDELLAGFCSPGDLLVTRRPVAPVLVDGLAAVGITFSGHSIEASETVESALLADSASQDLLRRHPEFHPYAVLPDTVRLDWTDELPAASAVAEVNSKSWSNSLALELGLPGTGTVVRSVDELTAAVDGTVVVKDPYGVSGRAMLEVATPGVLRAVVRTLSRRNRPIELLVQPKFEKRLDFSGHLAVFRDGSWEFLGVQAMNNRGFRHIGSAPASGELLDLVERTGYVDVLGSVAKAVSAAGYWGPVGVDSMVLADGTVVPILEINARRSLGLLSLRLERRMPGFRLWQLELRIPEGRGIDDVVAALPGVGSEVVVLSGSGLAPPGGRVYLGLVCPSAEVPRLQDEVVVALAAAGLAPKGVVDAA